MIELQMKNYNILPEKQQIKNQIKTFEDQDEKRSNLGAWGKAN